VCGPALLQSMCPFVLARVQPAVAVSVMSDRRTKGKFMLRSPSNQPRSRRRAAARNWQMDVRASLRRDELLKKCRRLRDAGQRAMVRQALKVRRPAVHGTFRQLLGDTLAANSSVTHHRLPLVAGIDPKHCLEPRDFTRMSVFWSAKPCRGIYNLNAICAVATYQAAAGRADGRRQVLPAAGALGLRVYVVERGEVAHQHHQCTH
jgi:hypothetical protein